MVDDFTLVDLIAQREAVRSHLRGRTEAAILEWLRARGRLSSFESAGRTFYEFESRAGCRAQFFFDSDELIFVGDHTTFR